MSPFLYVELGVTALALVSLVLNMRARYLHYRARAEVMRMINTINTYAPQSGPVVMWDGVKTPELREDAPDAPELDELVMAYRGYSIAALNGIGDRIDYVLEGTYGAMWYGPELTATHSGSEAECRLHLSRGICACGIYALRDKGDVAVSSRVVAEVVLAGWVIPGSLGYRAEWARIQHLWVYEDTSLEVRSELSRRYECPVDVMTGSFPYAPYMGHGPSVNLSHTHTVPPSNLPAQHNTSQRYATVTFPTPRPTDAEIDKALQPFRPYNHAVKTAVKTTPDGSIIQVTYQLQ